MVGPEEGVVLTVDLHLEESCCLFEDGVFGDWVRSGVRARLRVGCGDFIERRRLGWHFRPD